MKENSFTRKLKENRMAFKNQQTTGYNFYYGNLPNKSGKQNLLGQEDAPPKVGEFATPNCSDINSYHFGQQIGSGAYAIVKECFHKNSGERVAIKQYDRSKLVDIQRRKQAIREIRIQSRLNH